MSDENSDNSNNSSRRQDSSIDCNISYTVKDEHFYFSDNDLDKTYMTMSSNIPVNEIVLKKKMNLYSKVNSNLTSDSTCSNQQCKSNMKKLESIKQKIKQIEQNYFVLVKNRKEQNEELEEIFTIKENEYLQLKRQNEVFMKNDIKHINNLKNLNDLEFKIFNMLDLIRKIKTDKLESEKNKELLKKYKNKSCVICYENIAYILMIPCNHLCVCVNCNSKVIGNCPICRAPLFNKIKVKFIEENNC